jgi:hypothetical protein
VWWSRCERRGKEVGLGWLAGPEWNDVLEFDLNGFWIWYLYGLGFFWAKEYFLNNIGFPLRFLK